MATEEQVKSGERFAVNVSAESHFSWIRTRLGLERTLMSWIRTSVSLIGFGFTIVQFFERLNEMSNVDQPWIPSAPRYLGLTMMVAGVMALVVSVLQFRRTVKYLRHGSFAELAGMGREPPHTPIYIISIVLILIGVFAILAVVTRAV